MLLLAQISFFPSSLFYIWLWALCVIKLDGHFHFGFSKSSKISNQKTAQIRRSTVLMCASQALIFHSRAGWLCHSLTEQSQRANKPQVSQYMSSHAYACPNKHINTQMCTPKARADVINTYATQMRKGPSREGQGNYSLIHGHKYNSTITQTRVCCHAHDMDRDTRDAKTDVKRDPRCNIEVTRNFSHPFSE